MKAFASLAGRRAVQGVAAGAATTAAQPSAQARECVTQSVPHEVHARRLEDQDWLVTDLDQEVLIFKPFRASEVDAAVEQVHAMMEAKGGKARKAEGTPTISVVIEELPQNDVSPASEAESYVSMGAEADAVLCEPFNSSAVSRGSAAASRDAGEMHDFLKIASKLLKRPGLQTEVFKCMLEDKEVRDLMCKQSRNLDAYLEAVGVHNPMLLQGPEPGFGAKVEEGEDDEGNHVLNHILEAVAACIDKTGSLLAGMGGWLRSRFGSLGQLLASLFGAEEEESKEGVEREAEQQGKQRGSGDAVLGAVMVVTTAVFCVLLARSPGLLRASGAAAGATAAAVAKHKVAGAQTRM